MGEDDDGNNVYVKMKYFLKYAATDGLKDDSPLYIFDSGFVKRKLTPVQKKRISGSGSSSSSSSSSEKRAKKASSASKGGSSSSGNEAVVAGSKRARSEASSPSSSSRKVIRVFGKRESGSSRADSDDGGDKGKDRPSKREEEHASTLLNDFMVPKYFKDDLFQYVIISPIFRVILSSAFSKSNSNFFAHGMT